MHGRRLEPTTPATASWPIYGVPQTPGDRNAATATLLGRLGIDEAGVPGVPFWRARALLHRWWITGACPAALLWMIDHHPDRPDHHRGSALRGTRDPLRAIGARLRPWQGRTAELPAHLTGIPGDYRPAQAARTALGVHLAQLRAKQKTR